MAHKYKEHYKLLFTTAHNAAKNYAGGFAAIAEVLGLNNRSLSDMLNPNGKDMPPMGVFLDVQAIVQCPQVANALARLSGHLAVESSSRNGSKETARDDFMHLVHDCSSAMAGGVDAFSDGRLTDSERQKMRVDLMALINTATTQLNSINDV